MDNKFQALWENTGQEMITVGGEEYPVVTGDEWVYKGSTSSCRYNAQCINGNIYLIEISGKVIQEDAVQINRLFRSVVDQTINENDSFTILNKLPKMTSVSSDARNEFIDYYLEQGDRVLHIYFGMNSIMRSVVNAGMKIFNRELDIRAARNIEEAFRIIHEAEKIHDDARDSTEILLVAGRQYHVLTKKEWTFENENGNFKEIIKRIGKDIYIRSFVGKSTEQNTKESLHFTEGIFPDSYYLIEDFTKFETTDLSSRNTYTNWLIGQIQNIHLAVFCGLNPGMKVIAKLALSVNHRLRMVRITNTVEDAVYLIEQHKIDNLPDKQVTQTEYHIRELTGILGRMDWLRETDQPLPALPPENPFSDLYSIVRLVQDDIRHIFRAENEQKQKLAESEENLKRAQEMANLGSWEEDRIAGIFSASDELYRIYGLELESRLTVALLLNQTHPDDQNRMKKLFQTIERGKNDVSVEYRILTPGGEEKWISLNIKSLRADGQNIIKLMGTALDITKRKRIEEELQKHHDLLESLVEEKTRYLREEIQRREQKENELLESENQFRVLAETAPVAVLIYQDRKWVYANPVAIALCGYSPEEMYNMQYEEFIHVDYKKVMTALRERVRTGDSGVEQDELIIITKQGDEKWIFLSGARTQYRGRSAVIISIIDITSRKQTEEELRQHRENLEELVEARTVELKNEITERKRAEHAAEAANRSKSEFLANMSHEIRTPMNGVIGMTTLLLNSELSDTQQRYLDIVKTSAESLLGLINNILDFSKIEAGQQELEEIDFNLFELAESVFGSIQHTIENKSLELLLETKPETRFNLFGDAAKLRQILINLIGNAVKFTDAGYVRLIISQNDEMMGQAPNQLADLVFIHLEIEDTGIGIPENKLDDIFESFHQLDGSYTRKHGGTGLGLAIVKRLVGVMNGQIAVSSKPGEGTLFTLDIPFRPGRGYRDKQAILSPPEIIPDISGKVLLVEDDLINQEVAGSILEKWEIDYLTATNGREAVELYKSNDIELILMDIQMPVMDGLAATEKIRSLDGEKAQVPIIAMTAHAMLSDRDMCRAAGMDGYIAKPISLQELSDIMIHIMNGGDGFQKQINPVLNRMSALNRMGGDQSIYDRVLSVFLAGVDETVSEIRERVQARDHKAVFQLAHAFKSQTANIGAEALSGAVLTLETEARKGNSAMFDQLFAEITRQLDLLMKQIT